LEAATGLDLAGGSSARRSSRERRSQLSPNADIFVDTPKGEFSGCTASICYTGVLALLPSASIPIGTAVDVCLSYPSVELEITIAGKIIHNRRCDGGVTAHAIQLHYPAERVDETMAFIEFLQNFNSARRDALIAGKIGKDGLGPILDMFVNTSPSGTLKVKNGNYEGRIVFSENYILRCALSMATGVKALARMFRWTEGSFEFHRDLQMAGVRPDPQPLEVAMMMASVQMDEMGRAGVDSFEPDETFRVADGVNGEVRDSLDDLEREVLEFAGDGFSVEAVSDMTTAPDSDIYSALGRLLERGALLRSA
jgi:hypothetical protein